VHAFYQGSIATKIVAAVREHERAGDLSLDDLMHYRAKVREPVCSVIRVYTICGMGPPSSGSIAVMQMLGMLQQHHLENMQPNSLAAGHYFAEAGRLAFADRDRYVADPDFVTVPVHEMLALDYLQRRGALIDSRFSMGRATAGELSIKLTQRGIDHAADLPSTSHMVAIDQQGNAVSMTSTIEFEFGSKIFVEGFLLNNQLTDFSLTPTDPSGALIANRVEAGKRPRSSMAPLIVLKDNKPYLLLGSPGGSSIINYVAKTLIGVIDWQLDVQQAIALPNMGSRNKETELERGSVLEKHQSDLQAMGHRVTIMPFPSGVQAIMKEKNGLSGGADPRREGSASGD
jgi:gamma-glutamyltranspeptidase/glutathione hydrolase